MSEHKDWVVSQIMEQVQVFASTYSLAGSRFDDGTKFEQSKEEKQILKSMIEDSIPCRDGSQPSETEKLKSALQAAVDTIQDYLAYTHDGDPWKEDSRAMGEMDINDYGRDGRLQYALGLLGGDPPKQ